MFEVMLFACWFSGLEPYNNTVEEFQGCQMHVAGEVETAQECRTVGSLVAKSHLQILKKQYPNQIPKGIFWCEPKEQDS